MMGYPKRDQSTEGRTEQSRVLPATFYRKISFDVGLHDIAHVIRVRVGRSIGVRFTGCVLAITLIAGRNTDENRRLDFVIFDEFVHDAIQIPAAVTETTMRIVPNIL